MSATISFRKSNQITIFGTGVVSPNHQVQVTGGILDGSTKKSFTLKGSKTASLIADDNTLAVNHTSSAGGAIALKFMYSEDGGKTWKPSTFGTHVHFRAEAVRRHRDIVTQIIPDSGDKNHHASITIVQMPLTMY
ncbi:hypothetical protein CONPUDRAFT_71365 [Coniophora puteana RWD-64-598 SS2]|uniref:Uncharacterized protein n=1 Tax=Coniophora puteana (strain RWD-64-598) TaxID=741705 RepID=A0A5M3MU16_CONPW|nr:uncharacterized protein CONPUDRAFT_71365 [Coniophora puteana RWD-64-598 SS2]EIW82596.1 hypothetical protein CONPUDRAFT_71365 [Coniophora puteana RWD-64-598 SS2]